MEPGADGCDSGKTTVTFSLAWLTPLSMLLQTGLDLCHEVRGPCVSAGGEAGERPPFSTLRACPNEHPSFRCARVSSWLQLTMSGHRAGFRRQPATVGPLPFKAKEIVLMLSEHETVLVLGKALHAPEVMLYRHVQGAFTPND